MSKKPGKPKADLSDRLPIFEQAILNGKGITESLAIAEIPDRTYYNYCGEHPEYRQKIVAMKRRVLDASEGVIIEELTRKPENEEQRAARLELAERHYRAENPEPATSIVPAQIQGAQQINLNFGNQKITPEELNDLTDDELERVRTGEATYEMIRAERKLGKSPKPQRS